MLIDTEEKFSSIYDLISKHPKISIDLETTGLDPYKSKDKLCGVSVSFDGITGYYLPFRHYLTESQNLDMKLCHKFFDRVIETNRKVILFNSKFDLKMLLMDNIDLRVLQFVDTMILAHFYDENLPKKSLKYLASKFVDSNAADEEVALKKLFRKRKLTRYSDFSATEIESYASKDSVLTYKLFEFLFPKLDKRCFDILKVEHDLVRVLIDIENYGIKVDLKYISDRVGIELPKIKSLETEIFGITKCEFNILSNKQLTGVMNSIGIYSPIKTEKTGSQIWNDEVLLGIDNSISQLIREYRSRSKLKSTYLDPIFEKNDNGIIHTDFKSLGTRTGRFSCVNPPLQTIPKYSIVIDEKEFLKNSIIKGLSDHVFRLSKDGSEVSDEETFVRNCFISRNQSYLLDSDYSQIEGVVFAELADDEEMILFSKEEDLHESVSIELFGDTDDKLKKKMNRQFAKYVQFGILYGMGNTSLAKMIGISEDAARKFRSMYFSRFSKVKQFQRKVISDVIDMGVVYTYFGRPRHLSRDEAYKGINSIVQGTCADMLKISMIKLHNFLKSTKSHILLSIHDELLFEIHESEINLIPEIERIMTDFNFRVEIRTESKISKDSWVNCKPYELVIEGEKCILKC